MTLNGDDDTMEVSNHIASQAAEEGYLHPSPENISTRVATTIEEFRSLQVAWDDLHDRAEGTVFQTFTWNSTWWDLYHNSSLLKILTVWDGMHLIGVLPMFRETMNLGAYNITRLRLLGAYEIYGEYAPLVDPDFRSEVAARFADFCREEMVSGSTDLIEFFRFSPDCSTMSLVERGLRNDGLKTHYVEHCMPRITMELPASWEEYLDRLSANQRELLHRRWHSLEKHGVKVEVLHEWEADRHAFEDFVRLHTASWQKKGGDGYFGYFKRFEDFHRTATRELMRKGTARLYFLTMNGVRFAAVQAFFMHGQCCFYLSGLDREHRLTRYSPGKVLLSLVIKDAIKEGYRLFDFQGGKEEYKFHLGGTMTAFSKLLVWRGGIRSIGVQLFLFVQTLRRLTKVLLWDEKILPAFRRSVAQIHHLIAPPHIVNTVAQTQETTGKKKNMQGSHPQQVAHNEVHVDVCDDFESLGISAEQWDALLEASPRPVVYLTYEWLSTWWKCHRDARKKLHLVVVRQGSKILGIAPLMTVRKSFFMLPVREVNFVSMMDYADSPSSCAGMLDIIILDKPQVVVEHILNHLHGARSQWDMIRLHPIHESSRTLHILEQEASRRGLTTRKRMVLGNAYVYADTDWDTYLAKTFGRSMKRIRSSIKKLKEKGGLRYHVYQGAGEAEAGFGELMDIERRSWKWEKGVSVNAVIFRDFYRLLTEEMSKKGWLRLWMLEVGGKNIAYDYHLVYHGNAETMKGSYDSMFREYSPGNLLMLEEFKSFFNDGVKRINLEWGDMDAKNRWNPRIESHYEILIFNRTLFGRIIYVLYWPLGLYRYHRIVLDLTRRLARKLGILLRNSELTRSDQLR